MSVLVIWNIILYHSSFRFGTFCIRVYISFGVTFSSHMHVFRFPFPGKHPHIYVLQVRICKTWTYWWPIEAQTNWPPSLQMTFSNAFLWRQISEFRLKFNWISCLRVKSKNKWALVLWMAWRWTGYKSLFEPMMSYFIDAYMHHSASMG